jgi:siroheme synthase (precorrin-2 oxidase/ferrochelatase)
MPDADPREIQVTLTATGNGPPLAIRVRRFLKAALRGYGLRCTSIEEMPTRASSVDQGERTNPVTVTRP